MEEIRQYCLSMPAATETIKWEMLSFLVAEKIFCLVRMDGQFGVTFKCSEEDFAQLTEAEGIEQAAYFARNKWVTVTKATALDKAGMQHYLRQSYNLVVKGLSKKSRTGFGV